MKSNEEKARVAIAEQAGEWFVANDEGPLDARDSAALAAWFQASPAHIEEFLGVSTVARDLKLLRRDPGYSLEAILARARAEDEVRVYRASPRDARASRGERSWVWRPATAALAACAILVMGLFVNRQFRSTVQPATSEDISAMHFETRHGELLARSLPDHSVMHLNTDSAVSIRYSKGERLVTLSAGQASFEVTHEAHRAFRVHARGADITDLGTRFDVRLDAEATVVTVVEGRVAVGPSAVGKSPSAQSVEVKADQQLRVAEGQWPAKPVAVDAKRATSWSHGKLIFENETLERVVAEYNRYTPRPIEIATPALRHLRISGVFATDDADAFIAFLRSLKGVRLEVTDTRIRVFRE
jgi:transmembrane sensor